MKGCSYRVGDTPWPKRGIRVPPRTVLRNVCLRPTDATSGSRPRVDGEKRPFVDATRSAKVASGGRAHVRLRKFVTATALFMAGCTQSPEQIVTGTSHCTEVRLTPDLTMRLSSYFGYPDSIRLWVVQACHPSGTACTPVLTYDHASPPVYEVNGSTVTANLLGGLRPRILREHVKMGSSEYVFRVHRITGRVSRDGVQSFMSHVEHKCPANNQPYPR